MKHGAFWRKLLFFRQRWVRKPWEKVVQTMKFESQPTYLYFDSLINGNPKDILTNFTSGSRC